MEILRKDSITGFRVASDEYSEPSRTSKLELFSKIVNGWKPLTIFAESFILDVRLGSKYVSEHYAFSFFFFFEKKNQGSQHCVKSVHMWSFSDSYFPAVGLNTETYWVFLRIQCKCGKIQTRKTPNTDTFHAVQGSSVFKSLQKTCQIKFWK